MSRCFTWFPISGIEEPNIYQNLMWITMCGALQELGRLLGQSSVTATSAYLGVSDNSALELARSINV